MPSATAPRQLPQQQRLRCLAYAVSPLGCMCVRAIRHVSVLVRRAHNACACCCTFVIFVWLWLYCKQRGSACVLRSQQVAARVLAG
jgi:hypothetical protein